MTEERDLKSIGLGNFDVVIVAISSDVRASIMATVMAKEMGVHKVVCKAKDELQAKVLYKIGADKVAVSYTHLDVYKRQGLQETHFKQCLEIL